MPDDMVGRSRALIASARAHRVQFLRVELQIAHTLLDTSFTTHEELSRERQRFRAEQACTEVSRALEADRTEAYLTDAERQELTAGVARVHERLDAPC
jgi:multidrug resistance efflux pump